MSEFGPDYEQQPAAFEQLESMVRSACGYLQPTDDLRPNALEAARDACRQRRATRRLGGLAIIVLLVATTGIPDLLFSAYPEIVAVQSAELHRLAARSTVEKGTETNWALYEAFSELRRDRSARLHPAD